MNWYRKAQEDDLVDSFYEFVADEGNKVKQGDLKNWPDGEWLVETVKNAIMERARKLLSEAGKAYISYEGEVIECVTNALGKVEVTKNPYLDRMAGLVAVSVLMDQSINSVLITESSEKEIAVYAKLMGDKVIRDKETLRKAREIYLTTFKNSSSPFDVIAQKISYHLPSSPVTANSDREVKTAANSKFTYSPDSPQLIKGVIVDHSAIADKMMDYASSRTNIRIAQVTPGSREEQEAMADHDYDPVWDYEIDEKPDQKIVQAYERAASDIRKNWMKDFNGEFKG